MLWTWLLQLGLDVLDSMYVVHLLAVGLITPGQPYCVMHVFWAETICPIKVRSVPHYYVRCVHLFIFV